MVWPSVYCGKGSAGDSKVYSAPVAAPSLRSTPDSARCSGPADVPDRVAGRSSTAAALAEAAVARGDPARTPLWFAELLAARSSPPADQSMLPE